MSERGNHWDRAEREPQKAFNAFVLYREIDPSERTVTKVAIKLGCSLPNCLKWSRKWDWVHRVASYDSWIAGRRAREQAAARASMAERQARLGSALQDSGARRLIRQQEKIAQNPAAIDELSLTEAARIIDTGVKIERLARGESTENLNPVTPSAPPTEYDLSKLTDEELDALDLLHDKARR